MFMKRNKKIAPLLSYEFWVYNDEVRKPYSEILPIKHVINCDLIPFFTDIAIFIFPFES